MKIYNYLSSLNLAPAPLPLDFGCSIEHSHIFRKQKKRRKEEEELPKIRVSSHLVENQFIFYHFVDVFIPFYRLLILRDNDLWIKREVVVELVISLNLSFNILVYVMKFLYEKLFFWWFDFRNIDDDDIENWILCVMFSCFSQSLVFQRKWYVYVCLAVKKTSWIKMLFIFSLKSLSKI